MHFPLQIIKYHILERLSVDYERKTPPNYGSIVYENTQWTCGHV